MNTMIHFRFFSNKKSGFLLLLVLLFIFSNSFETVYAAESIQENSFDGKDVHQRVTVKGVVVDAATGETLIGANVIEKGTSNGTVTNTDGSFQLSLQSSNAVLIISYIDSLLSY